MNRVRSSRAVGALLAVVMVAGGLAVVPRLQTLRDADVDDDGAAELDLDDGRSVPDAAGAAPGDPITLTVIVETVDRSGAPTTTTQAFDVSTFDASSSVTPLPALDTSTATARPDRSSVGVIAGDVSITVPAPSGWSTRSARCGSVDVRPAFSPTTGEWFVQTKVLSDTTCRIVQAADGASITVIARTVDRSGVEVPTASDLRFRWSTSLGSNGTALIDTDPFSSIPASISFEGPPSRWTITQDANGFGPLVSVVCDGQEIPLIGTYPSGQLPRSGVTIDLAGPITCVFTTMEMEGLHTVRVVHRTIDANGFDVASNEVFSVTALTNEGSGLSTFSLDSDPTTATSDRFTVSHFASVARLSVAPRAGWELASVVCNERSFPLDAAGTGASVPLIDDTVCVLTSRRSSATPPPPGLTVGVRTVDASGIEIEATDPADVFDVFAFDFAGWFESSSLDTNPATAAPNRVTVQPPANADVLLSITPPVGGPRTWELVSLVCDDGPPLVQTTVNIFVGTEPVVCTATVRLGAPASVQVTLETLDRNGAPVASATLIGLDIRSGGSPSSLTFDTDPATARASSGTAVLPAGRALVSTGVPSGWRFVGFTCDTATPVPVSAVVGRAFEVDVAGSISCRLVLQQATIELTLQYVSLDAAGAPIQSDAFVTVGVVAELERRFFFDSSTRTTGVLDRYVTASEAGTHVFSVVLPRGWELAAIECDGVAAVGNATTRSIDVQADSRCVVTLRERSTVPVTVTVETSTAAGLPISTSDEVAVTLVGGVQRVGRFDTDPATTLLSSAVLAVPVGSYRLTVEPAVGWDLTDVTCAPAASPLGSGYVLEVDAASSCTVRVRQRTDAVVRIVTTTVGPGGSTSMPSSADFGYDRTGDAVAEHVLDTDPATARSDRADVATPADQPITVRALVPTGWQLADVSCTGGTALVTQDASGAPTGVRITPVGGTTVECTFRHQTRAAALAVVLETIDASGGSVVSASPVLVTTTAGVGPFELDTDPTTARPSSAGVSIAPTSTVLTPIVTAPWRLAGITCNEASTPVGIIGAAVTIGAGERVVCVVTVERPTTGTANVQVRLVTEGPTGVEVDAPVDVTVRGTGSFGTAVLDTDTLDAIRASQVDRSVAAGTLSLTQDVAAGWTLRSVTCTGAASATTRAPGGVLEGVDLTFVADAQVSCVFVVRSASSGSASITVRVEGQLPVDVVGLPAGEVFGFQGSAPIGPFELDLDTTSAMPQQRTFVVPAGAYTLAELVVPGGVRGWDLVDIACNAGGATDVNGGTAGQPGLIGTTLTLASGADVTCSFVNRGDATRLSIFHRTVDANGFRIDDPQNMTYTVTAGGTAVRTAVLNSTSSSLGLNALPGTYRVTVAPVAGWVLQDVQCQELATPVFVGGQLTGVDIAIGTQATRISLDCTFVHRRASIGTARFTISIATVAADGVTPIEVATTAFEALLVTPRGEIVRREPIDTNPATTTGSAASVVVEAGTYGWMIGIPLASLGQFEPVGVLDCSLPPSGTFAHGFDLSGDQVPDTTNRVSLVAGADERCDLSLRAIDYPSNVRLLTRVVDAQGGDFRYDRTITYRTTFGNGSVVESTVATTDNFIRQLSGRPGTWRITTTPPNGLTFRGIACLSIATGATVTVSPFSDAFGVGGSFPTVAGDNYDCTLDLQVVEPGRLTLVKRTFDGQGVEVFVDEDFQMAINPFVGGFSMDTSTADADNIPFEQYTRNRVMSLPVGTYTFVEGSSPAFALQSITCSGPGSANVTVNRNATRVTGATIPIATGDDIVCIVNNGAEATTNLTVRVNTLTTGGRLYQDPTRFTLTEPGGSFELSSLPGGGVQATRTFRIAANRPIRITEAALDGWELSDITCSLGLVTEVREAGLLVGMDIVVAPNENPVCSFSNTGDRARVTVVAATERDGTAVTSDQVFRIGGATVGPFTLDTSPTSAIAEEATATVGGGSLTLLADAVAGWTLDRVTCTEASGRPSFGATSTAGGVVVDVQAGDQIRCVFVHRDTVAPPPPPVNRVPVCVALSLSVVAGSSAEVAPSCTDPDGDALTYAVGGSPAKGSVSVVAGRLRFVAAAGSSGAESFTYTASDGKGGSSDPAVVSVTVTAAPPPPPVNRVPVCVALSLSVVAGSSAEVAPSCTDPDGDPLTFAVGGSPAKGTASVVAGRLRFVAAADASGAESFTYTASDGKGGSSDPAVVSVTITAAPPPPPPPPPVLPVVSVVGGSVVEGTGAGVTVLRFTVQLSAPAPVGGSTVRYVASAGSASSYDFTAVSGTATIAAGARSVTVDVPVTRDAVDEPDETVVLTISSPSNATLGAPSSADGTILDDDEPVTPPSVEVSLDTWWVCIAEGDAIHSQSFEFVITLSEPAVGQGVTVRYRTADGLATAGEDYVALDGQLVIPAGQVRAFVQVRFIGDDLVEEHEDFFLELVSTSANAVIGVDRRSRGIIANDD